MVRGMDRGVTLSDELGDSVPSGADSASDRVPRHCGYRLHPQKSEPGVRPRRAIRWTIVLPHSGHIGETFALVSLSTRILPFTCASIV
jgi:hypothetical protein